MASRAERAAARAAAAQRREEERAAQAADSGVERQAICRYLVTKAPLTERVFAGEVVPYVLNGPAQPELVLANAHHDWLEPETVEWDESEGNQDANNECLRRRALAATHLGALREWGISPAFLYFVEACKHRDPERGLAQYTELKERMPGQTLADHLAIHKDDSTALISAFRHAACQVLLALEVAQYRVGLEYDAFPAWHVQVGNYEISDTQATHVAFRRPGDVTYYLDASYFRVNRVMLCVTDYARTRSPKEPLPDAKKYDFSEQFSKCVQQFFTDAYFHPSNPHDPVTQKQEHAQFQTRVLSTRSKSYVARTAMQQHCDEATLAVIHAGASGKYCPSQMLNMPYFYSEFAESPEHGKAVVVGDSEAC